LVVSLYIRDLGDTADEVVLLCLLVLLYSLEFESSLLLLDELLEEHISLMSILRIAEGIDHLHRLFEEGTVRGVYLLAYHYHLQDIAIPVIEYMLLTLWGECRKYHRYVMAVFSRERASFEEELESRICHREDE
jgi:hypothetical protein